MEKHEIIKNFVNTYVVKRKRERSLYELINKRDLFVNKLNHQILELFDENRLTRIDDTNLENIKSQLKATSKTRVYVISHNELDNSILELETALNQLLGNGLGFCIVRTDGKGIFVEGEQEFGTPSRYSAYCFTA